MSGIVMFDFIREAVMQVPQVKPLLSNKARYMLYTPEPYKTYDYFLNQMYGLVRGVYDNNLGGDFIDITANLISGQLLQAYQQALEDQGFTDFIFPDYLETSYQNMVANQYSFVDAFFRAIVNARLDGTPIEPLLARAELWAGQWNTAYNEAVRLMTVQSGGNLQWVEGDTIRKCNICKSLDGIVAWASEWEALGIQPQNAPNDKLTSLSGDKDAGCGGWRCQCQLKPTNRRRSPNAFGRLEEILLAR